MLADAGIDTAAPGVVTVDASGQALASGLILLLGMHRVWERAELVMSGH